jgi:hypothetical protein
VIVGWEHDGVGRDVIYLFAAGDVIDILVSGAGFGGEACDSRVRCAQEVTI